MIEKNILECMTLVGTTPSKFFGEKVYVSTGAVDCDHIVANDTEMVTYENRPSRANLCAKEGDILFAKMCATTKTLLIDSKTASNIYSTGFFAVSAIKNVMTTECLYHLLSSEQFLRQKDMNCSGATQKAITNVGLSKIKVKVPSIDEQHLLTNKLSKIDELMMLRQNEITELDNIVNSRFIEMFGNPLHPKQSHSLGSIAILERGRFSPRPRNDPQYYDGDYPFIQTGDIANCDHRLSTYKQTLNEKGVLVSKKFDVGTIVIAIVGATIGATAILEIEVFAPDSVIGITVDKKKYNNIFLEKLLQFWQPELLRIAPESARANINLSILQKIPIVDAELELQQKFAAYVNQVNMLKLEIKQSLKELEMLKQSLMQKYFG